MGRLIPTTEVIKRLGVTRATANRWIRDRGMPGPTVVRHPHGPNLFDWTAVEEWATEIGHYDSISETTWRRIPHRRGPRTSCTNAHALTDDNVYVWGGKRRCRICRLAYQRDRLARLKAAS